MAEKTGLDSGLDAIMTGTAVSGAAGSGAAGSTLIAAETTKLQAKMGEIDSLKSQLQQKIEAMTKLIFTTNAADGPRQIAPAEPPEKSRGYLMRMQTLPDLL